ncbi:MAG TPA: hypothetical protein DDY41_02260, partial [Arthrobacter bacterium]|nr:hypothetical protein [Arthrobacter sp.]
VPVGVGVPVGEGLADAGVVGAASCVSGGSVVSAGGALGSGLGGLGSSSSPYSTVWLWSTATGMAQRRASAEG